MNPGASPGFWGVVIIWGTVAGIVAGYGLIIWVRDRLRR